jgi:putative ABC transport system substrate-binding protein
MSAGDLRWTLGTYTSSHLSVLICAGAMPYLSFGGAMRRREFIKVIGGAATWPLSARAQQAVRMPHIGILLYAKEERAIISPVLGALESLGYVDGKTVRVEYRDADGHYERLQETANELTGLKPDVIFSFGGEQAPFVKNATATIPVVVVVSNDPVASGLVASLGRPGGNITGLTYVHDMLAGKSVELLKEAVPQISRVAVLWNPNHVDPEFRETQRASEALGVQLQSLEVRQPSDFDGAFQAASREGAEALIVLGSRLMFRIRQRVGNFVEKNRLILVGVPSWLMEVGALLSYGPNTSDLFRRASTYIDKILRGARPSDLPMQQPTTFELIINLKVAKSFGIIVPPTVLARADKMLD